MLCLAPCLLVVSLLSALRVNAEPIHGPETWFHVLGGNVRKDGLRLDMEAIRNAGLSGVHFFHIGGGDGNVKRGGIWPGCEATQTQCLGVGWDDIVGFLGDECSRLGLALTLQNCPGWSQSGGPWIDLNHCQRDVKIARCDVAGGAKCRLPEIPKRFQDRDSDWRDICTLAFPTPKGDRMDEYLVPSEIEKDGNMRIVRFAKPVTVRSLVLPGISLWNPSYAYERPWLHVALDVMESGDWREVVRSDLPVSNWRDTEETWTLACGEAKGSVWRFYVEHDLPIRRFCEPKFSSAPRLTDWEGKSGRTLRSLPCVPSPAQNAACFVDSSRILDLTGISEWTAPEGCQWTVVRFGHVNSKRKNAPAPPEATGWECDKLDPAGIEASFNGYVRRLSEGALKGKLRGMLVDSWECFCQTWTPRMEKYFNQGNGYELRKWMPALFGWIVDSPDASDRFLVDWRRTLGRLVSRNYYGRMAELAHSAGIEVYFESAFGDIIYGDILEYWKYADAPMCEFWYPHKNRLAGGCCWYSFKPIRPCASAAHIYGKRRVSAEAFTGSGIQWDEDFKKLQDDANRHFARGVTHLVLHSYTHAPVPDAIPPGACMGGYNGTPFTRLQTWWSMMSEFTSWARRCEELLESGQPSQDVLWYLGDAVDHVPDEQYAFPEGFRADYLNHDVLTNRLMVRNGQFTIPEEAQWKVLWVPDERFMLKETRLALDRLSAAGGKIVYGGKEALLRALSGIQKDVATEPSLGDGPNEDFMWIHRRNGAIDRYFVAAGTNGWRGKVTFRAAREASIFDPVSCERYVWTNGDVLEIPPSRSVFVEFGTASARSGYSINDKRTRKSGSTIDLDGWTISFPSGWGALERMKLEKPMAWSHLPELSREAQAFCGTAVYEAEFDCLAADSCLELDLGRVDSIATVFVNGNKVNTLWCEPYKCKLEKFLIKGKNRLRIEVTNTWRNRIVYDLGQPEKDRKTWILYKKRFSPGPETHFVPSGITGPVRLVNHSY